MTGTEKLEGAARMFDADEVEALRRSAEKMWRIVPDTRSLAGRQMTLVGVMVVMVQFQLDGGRVAFIDPPEAKP